MAILSQVWGGFSRSVSLIGTLRLSACQVLSRRQTVQTGSEGGEGEWGQAQ